MPYRRSYDVSVVVPFNDDEEVIGTAVRHLAEHLREQGVSFEIIAVDEYSGDNSHAILALLRRDHPELRIVHVGGRGRGYDCGVRRAMGRVLWLIEPAQAAGTLAPFGRAYRHVERGERDVVVVAGRFAVAHRIRALPAIQGLKGLGAPFHRRLIKRAVQRRLDVDTQVIGGGVESRAWTSQRPLARLIGALSPARAAFADRDRW